VKKIILLIAEGFGTGLSPIAPGTCGSVIGLLWFLLLIAFQNLWLYILGSVVGILVSIYLCGIAEDILKIKDPPPVVLDEIVSIPVCYIGWVILAKTSAMPALSYFFSGKKLIPFLGIFLTFRLLDALKPFPINIIQRLNGGLGIVADDILAAILTSIIWFFIIKLSWF